MPVSINAPKEHGFDEPIGLLCDCHRRIERFLDVLARIGRSARPGEPLNSEQIRALESARRYFSDAAPNHTADEEESLFPRLRGAGDRARESLSRLKTLERDHERADDLHAAVDQIADRWLKADPILVEDIRCWSACMEELEALYRAHIELEETVVFPAAARVLDTDSLAAMGHEMARRRGVDAVSD